jgi:hypothetical protein
MAPVFAGVSDRSSAVGQAVSLQLDANDPEGRAADVHGHWTAARADPAIIDRFHFRDADDSWHV